MKYTLRKVAGTKRKKIWLVVGGAVLMAIIYGAVSVKVWQDFQDKTEYSYKSIQEKAQEGLSLPAGNETDKSKKREKLNDLYTTLEKEKDHCKINILFFWLRSVPVNKAMIDQCEQQVVKMKAFSVALNKVTAHLKSERLVAIIIASAAQGKTDLAESEWAGAVTHWAATEAKVRGISEASSFTATKNFAADKLKAIQIAWQTLIVASQAKDRAKYEEAVSTLAKTYSTLYKISELSETRLSPLIKELEQAHEALN